MQNTNQTPGYATRWKGLLFIGLSVIVISMDNTILNNALPAISTDLGARASDLQWIVDSYILVLAAMMLTMGAIGDRFGRKLTLQAGLILFGVSSLAAAVSSSVGMLVFARGSLGIGAAILLPSSLSIINATFPQRERAQAIAIWSAIFSFGVGLGPVLGGLLVQNFGWHSIFLINLPILAVAYIGVVAYLAESRDTKSTSIDFPGVILSIVGLFALVYGIIESGVLGWSDPTVIGSLIFAVVVLAIFGWWESRAPNAMLPLYLFRNISFTGANLTLAFTIFSLFGSTFFLSQYFQSVLGFTPLDAGIRVLPAALPMTFFASYSARLDARIGTKYTVALGISLVAVALFYLSRVMQVDTPYELVMIGQLTFGSGIGIAVSPATNSIMASVPVSKSGIGSAMNNTTRQLGGALGIAILGTIMNVTYLSGVAPLQSQVPAEAYEAARGSLQIAQRFAEQPGVDPAMAQILVDTAQQAFVDGITTSMLIGSIIMTLTTIAALFLIPSRVYTPEERAVEGGLRPEPAPVGD